MPREQISVDIPDEWNENMKHGMCWCGKDHTQFEKGQKFYCSLSHSKEYSKRIKYWSTFREEIYTKCAIILLESIYRAMNRLEMERK